MSPTNPDLALYLGFLRFEKDSHRRRHHHCFSNSIKTWTVELAALPHFRSTSCPSPTPARRSGRKYTGLRHCCPGRYERSFQLIRAVWRKRCARLWGRARRLAELELELFNLGGMPTLSMYPYQTLGWTDSASAAAPTGAASKSSAHGNELVGKHD